MEKERKLTSLYINPDLTSVEIKFTEFLTIDDEQEESGQRIVPVRRSIEAPLRPSKGLIDDIKSLRRHGLAILGIELADEAKQIKNWTVQRIQIAGDYLTKKSRLVMTLALKCDLTGKIVPIKVGQVTMYPKSEDKVKYHDAEKMTAIVEKIIEKCWNYLNGDMDEDGQFVLFARDYPEAVTV